MENPWTEEATTFGETPSDEVLIDSHVAATILGITLNNLRQHVWRKDIVAHGKAGRLSLFKKSEVEALAAKRAGKAASVA